MTKCEVLEGALALNGDNKKYTVATDGDKIIIEAKYRANIAGTRSGTFRCVAHLNDDNTYTETHSDSDGGDAMGGKVVKVQKSFWFTFGGESGEMEAEKDEFNSEDIKKVLRGYLESCGYTRTSKGFFKKLFGR